MNMRLHDWFGSEKEVGDVFSEADNIAGATEVQEMNANGNSTGNKPKRSSIGGISLSVWDNPIKTPQGEEVIVENVTIQRTYKDKEGNFQHTSSIPGKEIWKVQALCQRYLEKQVKEQ